MKTLVTGWFSFEGMGATAGDVIARDIACEWLASAGRPYDVAVPPPFANGIDWRRTNPADYREILFVCGPFPNNSSTREFLARFADSRLLGLNLTMIEPVELWNPFDILFERDSSVTSRPDITFLAPPALVPVVGVILVHPQPEYRDRGRHSIANAAIDRLIRARNVATVAIDTRMEHNSGGLRTPGEIESVIAKMDVVVTTRLHGTVFALKNGVPPLVIDPIAGGAKISKQLDRIGWPVVFSVDGLSESALDDAFSYCLTSEARNAARECAARAASMLDRLPSEFITAINNPSQPSQRTNFRIENLTADARPNSGNRVGQLLQKLKRRADILRSRGRV
jgi:hypothetical protein